MQSKYNKHELGWIEILKSWHLWSSFTNSLDIYISVIKHAGVQAISGLFWRNQTLKVMLMV